MTRSQRTPAVPGTSIGETDPGQRRGGSAHTALPVAGLARLVAVVATTLIALPAASAQNAEAELLFREGDRLMETGEVAKACEAFAGSNRIEPRAGTLIRLGDCREKNQQLASAWSAFSDALARVKDPRKREIAQARVTALEPRLSYLTISVPDESRVAGLVITRNGKNVDAALWNRGAPVDGGDYVVAGRAPGHEEWSTRVTVKPESDKIAVEVPRFKELGQLAPTPGDGVGGPIAPAGPTDTPPLLTTRRKIALGAAGAGVVVLALSAMSGSSAKSLESQAHDLCPSTTCVDHAEANALLEDARGKARRANLGYGIAAAAGVGAGVLWLTGKPRAGAGVALAPVVEPGLAGAAVMGRF
jgi:hypothetical protein